jgi:hypothetical protein
MGEADPSLCASIATCAANEGSSAGYRPRSLTVLSSKSGPQLKLPQASANVTDNALPPENFVALAREHFNTSWLGRAGARRACAAEGTVISNASLLELHAAQVSSRPKRAATPE